MHCLSCSNNSNFALFCLLYHVLYKKKLCGSSTCCHCHALGCEIRLCSESNWVHFHASQKNDIYFSDFFFIFSYLQLRARHNYFHQGPRTLSGGGKRSKTQRLHLSGSESVSPFLSVLLFKELCWCQKLSEMFMNIQETIKFEKKVNQFFVKKRKVCHKKVYRGCLVMFFF